MKQKPWRTLRCVVEVKVPPGNRSDEGDLVYHVREALSRYEGGHIPLPRAYQLARYEAVPRIKRWKPLFRYFARLPKPIERLPIRKFIRD